MLDCSEKALFAPTADYTKLIYVLGYEGAFGKVDNIFAVVCMHLLRSIIYIVITDDQGCKKPGFMTLSIYTIFLMHRYDM